MLLAYHDASQPGLGLCVWQCVNPHALGEPLRTADWRCEWVSCWQLGVAMQAEPLQFTSATVAVTCICRVRGLMQPRHSAAPSLHLQDSGTYAAETQLMSGFVQYLQGKGLAEHGMLKFALDSEHVLLDATVWSTTQQPTALKTLGELNGLPALRTGA